MHIERCADNAIAICQLTYTSLANVRVFILLIFEEIYREEEKKQRLTKEKVKWKLNRRIDGSVTYNSTLTSRRNCIVVG